MKVPTYQKDLSRESPILLDETYKGPKIAKMLAVLAAAEIIKDDIKLPLALDIGCSAGFFTRSLSPYFTQVIGVDIDSHALPIAQENTMQDNVSFMFGDSQRLPLGDQSVDLVICNHVYEHVPSAEVLFEEIYRVLKPNAVCYLGAASRLTLIEPHYHLPFLSWLPKPLAHRYMRLAGKGQYYYECLRTLYGINRLVKSFRIEDFTLKVIEDPDRYRARDLMPEGSLIDKVPMGLWRLIYDYLPSYIFILRKPVESDDS